VKALDKSLAQAQQQRWLMKKESFFNFELALNSLPSHGLNLRGLNLSGGHPHSFSYILNLSMGITLK
jgi:hypothetical protein